MFSSHEYVLAAEADYRREQLIASLPGRRTRPARTARIAARLLGRTPAQAAPAQASRGAGVACAA